MVVRKMKEKCKDAARMRREKERTEFLELSKLLPLPSSTTNQLDKASIIRLTSSYLRMRAAFPDGLGERWGTHNRPTNGYDSGAKSKPVPASQLSATAIKQHCQRADYAASPPQCPPAQQQIKELGSLILQTLDGFVFALHKDGKIMYISETASVHLGLPQIDLTGSSIFEYIHPTDCNDINELFNLSETDKQQLEQKSKSSPAAVGQLELGRSFCMRMKCILPKRNAGLVSNGYKTIHCNGYMKVQRVKQNSDLKDSQIKADEKDKSNIGSQWEGYALVAVGHSLLPSASTEVKLGTSSFMFRASLDLKLYQIESCIFQLIGLDQSEMIGQSLYQFIHVDDVKQLAEAHKLLLNKGQVVTKYFRLMRRDGGFIWIESHASLINNPRSMPKPQHIVSVCYVIGQDTEDQSRVYNQQEQIGPAFASNEKLARDLFHHSQQLIDRGGRPMTVVSTTAAARKREHLETAQSATERFKKRSLIADVNYTNNTGFRLDLQSECLSGSGKYATIGSTRRASEDSCSIVSNMTSASVSSSGSSCSSHSSYLASSCDSGFNQQQACINSELLNPIQLNNESLLSTAESDKQQLHLDSSFGVVQSATVAIDSRPPVVSSDQLQQQQIWLVPMLNSSDEQHHATVTATNAFITQPLNGVHMMMDHYDLSTTSSHQKHAIEQPLHNYSIRHAAWEPVSKSEQQLSRNYSDNNYHDNSIQYEQQCKQYNVESCYHQLNDQHRHQFDGGFNYETSYITHVDTGPMSTTAGAVYVETEECPITEIQCHHHQNHYQHAVCLNDRYATTTTTMQIT